MDSTDVGGEVEPYTPTFNEGPHTLEHWMDAVVLLRHMLNDMLK